MNSDIKSEDIINAFSIPGNLVNIKVNNQGHINSTFISTFEENGETKKYTHQRINSTVFPHPDEVMKNIVAVTDHIRKKTENLPEAERRVLRVINTKDGKPYFIDNEGMYWRTYSFVDGVNTYDRVPNADISYNLGKGIGTFQSQLSDFDSSSLFTVIPHFHDMGMRFSQLRAAMKINHEDRIKHVKNELEFLFENEHRGRKIWNAFENEKLPMRVTHNDTKINNVLFSKETGEALCVIDLDTIMPGTILFDTGDMIRTACSTADEDEQDSAKMEFSIPFYKALYEGYMESAGSFLTDMEKENIKESGRTITEIMAVRFLTDYLQGDTYYKIAYPEHNLVRARTQIALMKSIDKQWKDY